MTKILAGEKQSGWKQGTVVEAKNTEVDAEVNTEVNTEDTCFGKIEKGTEDSQKASWSAHLQ